ncbi:MAG: M50 family metallopeptidase [Treponema sp.]|nr:M50 family metallopeptidase [Treponema sp.]
MRIVIGLICLCFLIFFHELGHFLVAKLFKIKVESFSIGMGPILFHKTIKGTDYRISLFPFGGYCGIKGEKDFQEALKNNYSKIEGEKDSMYGCHPFKRAAIGFAGPFFNFLFAFFAFTVILLAGYTTYSYSNKIIIASELDSSIQSQAGKAGLKTGDEIIKINNKKIEDFSDIIFEISKRPDEDIKISVLRDKEIIEFSVHSVLDKTSGTGKIGISADTTTLLKKEIKSKNFFLAIKDGFLESLNMTFLTLKGIFTLFKGVDLKNQVSGPARVADMIGEVVSESATQGKKAVFINLLNFMALISISLFLMNLLPIPVLDGALILFALIEGIFRIRLHPKFYYYIQFIGIFIIIIIFIIGVSGDFIYFKNLIRGSK